MVGFVVKPLAVQSCHHIYVPTNRPDGSMFTANQSGGAIRRVRNNIHTLGDNWRASVIAVIGAVIGSFPFVPL